jgi:hypothetical protein
VYQDDWLRIVTIALAMMLLALFLLMQHATPVQIEKLKTC